VLAVAIRASDGADWLAPGRADPVQAKLFELLAAFAAWACVARASVAFGERFSGVAALAGFAAGVAGHSLLLGDGGRAESWTAALGLAAFGTVLALSLARVPPPLETPSAPLAARIGLFALGVANAIALASTASGARFLLAADRESSTLVVAAIALLALLGAAAVAAFRFRRLASPFGVTVLALLPVCALLDAYRALATLASREGMETFLTSAPWSLSLDRAHSPAAALLVSGRVFALPAMLLGVALAVISRLRGRTWLLAGLAAGALVDVSGPSNVRSVEWTSAAPPESLYSDLRASGSVTVERVAGELVVEVDRKRWTPLREERELERELFERVRGAERVLLVGILTPERERLLRSNGATSIACSAPAIRELEAVERLLYAPSPLPSNGVRWLDRAAALAAAANGEFDAIFVPPVALARPELGAPKLPPSTAYFAWFDASAGAASGTWSPRVDVCVHDLERLLVAVTNRGSFDAGAAFGGTPPVSRFAASREELEREETLSCAERLEWAARDSWWGYLFFVLAHHFASQRPSAPFESRAGRVELDDADLASFQAAAERGEPRAFERDLLEGAARVLIGKRDLERIERFIEPLAKLRAPWPELERVLALADIEMLDPASAAERLALVLASRPDDVELARLRARCLLASRDPAAAVAVLEPFFARDPQNHALRRELALALVRAGDPRGAAEIEALLTLDPQDAELLAHRGAGPFPDLVPRVR